MDDCEPWLSPQAISSSPNLTVAASAAIPTPRGSLGADGAGLGVGVGVGGVEEGSGAESESMTRMSVAELRNQVLLLGGSTDGCHVRQ